MKIAIVAAGSWGTALSLVLNDNGHDVCVWARNQSQVDKINETGMNEKYLKNISIPKSIKFTSNMKSAFEGAEIILFSVPSQQYQKTLEKMIEGGFMRQGVILINVSKGIDMNTLETMSQITQRLLPEQVFVTLSGPSHAEEVSQKLPTALVSASKSRKAAELVQDLFANDYIRVYTNPDVVGVEISGALKNIIALGAGISDGLGYGDNAKAALITRGINEIAYLGTAMGATVETFRGLAGVGDLIVTCTSMHSRNRRCGILIGQGHSFDESIEAIGMVVEGAYTIKSAYDLMVKFDLEMPITTELYKVLYEGKDARVAVNSLMSRQKKHEIDEYAKGFEIWE
ncbi:NAD(P)H-dependent glycerol-3-phosphate dehydrogenase [Fusibacter ferrireducens]|uniref:Glycerol-3-phosphate dehydrogenase [NAD(P)+] n=1 Tax=Fusibacter ferrireducens TaxID=2785058 RepID=A0ABR9ZMD4_9FIRM|nr:NAD(P)H-dependent glycerol-3-phosphate dehydrogenase [Fusibacter ferrireducens]MBF4691633.1 NAD(P)H-dependent glycerol-3-phosphate dehydrogenase [Fusibacter ferrireducens]